MSNQRRGGSFAPPLTAEKLAAYAALIPAVADVQVKEIMEKLHALAVLFRQTGDSQLPGNPHPSGMGEIVPLAPEEILRIWDLVPWDYELKAMQDKLDGLAADSPLRTPAFHLLWMAKELEMEREPISSDKL